MILKGTVRNVIDFGAFVDIGVHQDGLVHISQMTERYIKHPLEAVSVGDVVEVKVLSVDLNKKRISLSMKLLGTVTLIWVRRSDMEETKTQDAQCEALAKPPAFSFPVTLNAAELWKFSMYHANKGYLGVFNVLFTIAAVYLLITQWAVVSGPLSGTFGNVRIDVYCVAAWNSVFKSKTAGSGSGGKRTDGSLFWR